MSLESYKIKASIAKTELYLYGDLSLDPIDNKRILLSTIQYKKDTQRFWT